MSIDRNFGRTLSGATDIAIDNLRLGNNINSIRINGNAGLPNQVIAKNGTTGKLEWDFVESTTIPDGSITGNKLASNITISTTGNIDAETIRANTFIAPKTGNAIVEINTESGAGIDINNGADIRMYSDSGGTNTLLLDGNTGTITISSNGKIQTYGVSEIMKVLNGGEINLYDDNSGVSKTISIVGETGTITCEDLNVNNHTGIIEFNEIKTDKLILPINGTANCEIFSNGNIITNGSITGGSIAGTSLASSTIITSTGSITSGGDITINGGNDLIVNNGGKVDLFTDDGTTRTFDIDGSTGDLKIYNPANGNEKIELDGTSGNVIIYKGGRIDMFDGGGDISIELNGANGIIDCEDINVLAHTGIISFDNLRCNTFSIPKTTGADFSLTTNSMTFSNPYTINGGSSNATFKTLVLNGGSGVADSLVINGNTITGTDAGGNDGSITMNTGDLTITAGELEVVAGNSVFRGGADFVGDNSVDIIDSNSDLQFRLNPSTGDFTASTGDITATAGDVIALAGTLRSDKVGSKPAPIDSSSYTDWALTLADTNSHAFVGGNLICNGTIYGNVEGTITEEIIDAQRLNLRADPSGDTGGDIELNMNVATGLNGRINQTYDAVAGTGGYLITTDGEQTFEITKNGNINRCNNIIMRGDTFNNFNSANFLMGTDNALISSTGTGASSFDRLTLDFGSSSSDSFINVRSTNVNRVVINKDGIDFNDSSTARLSIDSNTGDINFNTTVGAINGHSSTTPNAITNMTMFSVSNQLPHPRFVQICDPATHSTYTLGNGVWYNMAGYTDNNSTKPRFTNADLSFTAFSTTGRINVIFSASVNNNMGVRFRIVEINGVSAGIPITGTQRLFIGSSAHRGQHEYTCYYAGFTVGYEYVIAPEVYVGGSSSITMYVGSYNGSATIQDADSPIITEIAFMNRSTVNIGNIYVPPSGEDY